MNITNLILCAGSGECIHPTSTSVVPNHGKHYKGSVERCGLSVCWKPFPAGQVDIFYFSIKYDFESHYIV